jgi:small-conductance mechanosensitive channel
LKLTSAASIFFSKKVFYSLLKWSEKMASVAGLAAKLKLINEISDVVRFQNCALVALVLGAFWISYLLFLKEVSPERHGRIRRQGKSCLLFSIPTFILTGIVEQTLNTSSLLEQLPEPVVTLLVGVAFVGLAVGFYWSMRVMRLCAYIGLFLYSKKTPVPLLLINLATTLVGVVFALGITSKVFGVSLTPVLATSAILSLVLGLALQDTLGNLLSGIALQIDKPFRIGDWIECHMGSTKVTGRVSEVSWRATALKSFTDEIIIVPNRSVSAAHVLNFSGKNDPVLKSHILRLPFNAPFEEIETALLKELLLIDGICKTSKTSFLLISNEDSWVQCKLLYTLLDYGQQFQIGDLVLRNVHKVLKSKGIQLAKPQFEVFGLPTDSQK